MNRRTILAGAFAIAAARAVGAVVPNINLTNQDGSMGGQNMSGNMEADMIGKLSETEFMRLNEQGAAAVSAVEPTSAPLSKGDQKLMMEVAMGGMMQLEVSRIAVQKATDEDTRMLAEAEVAEQTGLKAKLMEIATAKSMTMPSAPDAKTQRMIAKMQGMSGADFDRAYIRESGVKGHQLLDKTMSKVESRATDPSLKALASAAHPLVRTHLQVSRDELAQMSGKGSMSMGNSNTRS
jgi:putative membrane protein